VENISFHLKVMFSCLAVVVHLLLVFPENFVLLQHCCPTIDPNTVFLSSDKN
jgi:hypothetical protein